MGKKKKSSSQEELLEVFPLRDTKELKEELFPEEEAPKEEAPKETKGFKATEWAKQDPDKPDYHLFLFWNSEGAIPQSRYEEVKKQVFRKK